MSDFNFPIIITRAEKDKDGNMFLAGEASNTNIDLYETVMTETCQEGFVSDIKDAIKSGKPLQLEVEHEGDKAPHLNIGAIIEGKLDNNTTKIKAKLDADNPLAAYYFKLVNNPKPELGQPEQLGFSIRGYVKESHLDYNEQLGKYIRHFDRIQLKKVGLVENPGNPDCYVEALMRSVGDLNEQKEEGGEAERRSEENVDTSPETNQEIQEEVEVNEVPEELENQVENVEVVEETNVAEVEQVTETNDASNEQETESKDEPTDEVGEVGELLPEAQEQNSELVEEVAESKNEEVVEEVVERGVLAEQIQMQDYCNQMRNLNSVMRDCMYFMMPSEWFMPEEDDIEESLRGLQSVFDDYASMCRSVYKACRSMDTSTTALQKEDLSNKIDVVKYSFKEMLESRNIKMPQNENTNVDNSSEQLDELSRKLEDTNTLNIELKNKVEELERKITELEKQPASNQANLLDPQVDSDEEKRKAMQELRNLNDKHLVAQILLKKLGI